MSNKSTDVTLNIKARNLAGKTLAEINDQVEQLAKNNDTQATSAERAARSMSTLNAESRQLAGAYRELSRREGLAAAFVEQRKQIGATAAKLKELTATYKQMQAGGGGTLIGFSDADIKKVGREIIQVERDLTRMVASNQKAGAALEKLGVDATDTTGSLAKLQQSVARAGDAYKASEAEIRSHANAQQRSSEVTAEAARRQAAAAREQEAAASRIRAIGTRGGELSALRADIEARSAVARATDVQAEAARRLAAEQAEATAKQERATAAIREATTAYDSVKQRRIQIIETLMAESVAQERAAAAGLKRRNILVAESRAEAESAARKERLAALLRRLSTETDQNTGAVNRNSAANRKAGSDLALFSDVGRKSLGTYQRLRGQILGLTAAYVGFYQVINTTQKAIAATNRNASLQVGLRTINNGDAAAAASDYAFLRKEADRLGLVFDTLAPQYANVAIAGRALGLNTTQMRDLFSDTATAAAAMNLSVEDTEGVFRAMTQIFSKGKVQAEELRGQLGDRLPGAVVKFAQANNIALSDLDKMLEQGTVGVDFLIKGIQGYAATYDKELDNISTRLQAYINRATNAYNDFLRSLLTGANDQKLKDAFARIEGFFQSRQGEEFAGALAKAFGAAIDVFIALADNIDIVVELVKIFIGLQVLKFLNDTVIGVVSLYTKLGTLKSAFDGTAKAALLASGATSTFTGRLKLLGLTLAPIAAGLAAVTGGVYFYIRGINEATKRTEQFADALSDLTFAKSEEQITSGLSKASEEVQALSADIEDLSGLLDKAASSNPLSNLPAQAQLVAKGFATVGAAEDALAEAQRRRSVLIDESISKQLRLQDVIAERQAQEAKDREAPLPGLLGGDGDAKVKDTSKADRNAENRRLTAARAISKELLDLDQAVLDARLSGEVRTAAEVQQIYAVAVDKIASETEERYLKLQQLAQASFAAAGINTPATETGDARADAEAMIAAAERLGLAEAANLRMAIERVEQLRLARNEKAFETSETQDIEVIERQINDLLDQRGAKIDYYNAMREAGLIGEVDAYNAINATQDGYNQRIAALVQTIMPLLQAIGPDDARFAWAQKLIADFDVLLVKQRQYTIGQRVLINLGGQFAAGAASAIVTLGRGLATAIQGANSLGDAFKNAADAFRTFAADFLQQIAEMILQAIILQAIKNAISGGSGGYWDAAIGALAGTNHTGGIVSGAGAGPKRKVNAAVFAGAQRFHTGGLPGLRAGEVATILKKGEEVVPEDNPRHIANAGGGGGNVNIDMITTLDPVDVTSAGLRSGRKTIVNDLQTLFRGDKNGFKSALGIRN